MPYQQSALIISGLDDSFCFYGFTNHSEVLPQGGERCPVEHTSHGEVTAPVPQNFPILKDKAAKQPWLPNVFKEFTHAGLRGGPKL